MNRGVVRVGVLASGGGSNFESLVVASRENGAGPFEIAVLIVNKEAAGAVERARRLGVEAIVMPSAGRTDRDAYFAEVARALIERRVEVVCLAGFLLMLSPSFLGRFPGRVLNVHPSLLPKHGGPGMYGRHVHASVLAAGDAESGCSVHVVDEHYDHGPVLGQRKVPVLPGDTPDSLAARVLGEEHRLYPDVLRRVSEEIVKNRAGGVRS